MVGTSKSYFDKIPEIIARSVSGRDAFVVDMSALSGHEEVKNVLARGSRREGEYSRTVFVFDHMERINDQDVAKLNALLRPMNREHALMMHGSQTIDFAGSLFFFLYRLPSSRSDSLGDNPNKEELKLFVGDQYSFDRNLFTPEAFVGRISNVLFFQDFTAQRGRQHYPCSDLFRSSGFMDSDSSSSLSLFIIGILVVGALIAFAATQRGSKKSLRKSQYSSSTNTASRRRTYDEDDSKGYPIRRSTRTRSSPSRYMN